MVTIFSPMIFPWPVMGNQILITLCDVQLLLQVRLVYIFQLLVLNDKHVLCPGWGSSGLKFSEEWPLIFFYPFGIIQPTRIKNNIHSQSFSAISAISFISLSFGGLFFAQCVRWTSYIYTILVFAAGPLARERVWTSRCGSKSRLGLGFMVSVFSWMTMIINRHPAGGFILMYRCFQPYLSFFLGFGFEKAMYISICIYIYTKQKKKQKHVGWIKTTSQI